MGNCCDGEDGDHDGPRRDEESERLLRSAPKDTPKSTLKYILQQRGAARHISTAITLGDQGLPEIDIALVLLDSPDLSEQLRGALLEFLFLILGNPSAFAYFNTPTPGLRFASRLDRLRVLLKEMNEELPGGEKVLDRVNYKSVAFEKIAAGWSVQYTLIVDKSGSMITAEHGRSRYDDAKLASEHLAEKIERVHHGHGMIMWLFSGPGDTVRMGSLQTCEAVRSVFRGSSPGGSTDLAGVLSAVMTEHFDSPQRRQKGEHVIIFTDGSPDDKDAVVAMLVSGINKLSHENEMGFTFMQVGCDHSAAEFLHELQDCLTEKGAKYNVVDCITHLQYHNMSLSQVIHQYLPF